MAEYKNEKDSENVHIAAHLHDIGKIGIPDGLKAEQIPVGARIIAICDSIDAMTSNRHYRKALG